MVMRDAGANMKKGMLLSDQKSIDCNVHKMQLLVASGLKEQRAVIDMIGKCRRIAGHFGMSPSAQNDLKALQEQLKKKMVADNRQLLRPMIYM